MYYLSKIEQLTAPVSFLMVILTINIEQEKEGTAHWEVTVASTPNIFEIEGSWGRRNSTDCSHAVEILRPGALF